jgi:hypothetical protein
MTTKRERVGTNLADAQAKLKSEGFEHLLDDQWLEDPHRMVCAGPSFESEVYLSEDGMGYFKIWMED